MLFAIFAITFAEEEEKYSSKYDDIDIDEILANPKLRNQYLDCYLGRKPCLTADAKYFKDKFPEAMATKCKKCTDKQVIFFDKAVSWFTENEPENWKKIVETAIRDAQNKEKE
ncbi:Ejaculatory bulb-specific protein 3 [Habropoda laboriosa]|uniref:Ejaculatory bulb-specific protein 3 n=2 Tax=Habropoda laboriosa TaxID=597456 RepID=A0A0L7R2K8_9HYME|nr:Ejaculatory bulb-specific protein 3 [Habropoda laboriosa]